MKCCVIRSLDEKLSWRNRTWEFYHLFGAPLAQLREEVARTLHGAFPIYKAPRTSPLCCEAHSVKLWEYFIMNNSFARFLTLCLFTYCYLMARYLFPRSLLEQTVRWSGWEFPLLQAEHGSYDLARWELRVPGKIPGRENG